MPVIVLQPSFDRILFSCQSGCRVVWSTVVWSTVVCRLPLFLAMTINQKLLVHTLSLSAQLQIFGSRIGSVQPHYFFLLSVFLKVTRHVLSHCAWFDCGRFSLALDLLWFETYGFYKNTKFH